MKCYYCSIVCILFCVLELVLSEFNPVCHQPEDPGKCIYTPRFYYNVLDGKCKLFLYSGCGGNDNNFESFEECEDTCGDENEVISPVCLEPKDPGECISPRFYYDDVDGKCKLFLYSGCGGNDNNFESFEECEDTCGDEGEGEGEGEENFDCELGPDPGPCDEHLPRYYYDEDDDNCKKFIYGGCLGNNNNFLTKSECYRRCGDREDFDCELDPDYGTCDGDFLRYYYDEADDTCKEFIYSGCNGNKNNFQIKFDCYSECGDREDYFDCELDPDYGTCIGDLLRYYYDEVDFTCKEFIYSGCDGNKNNFETEADCYYSCGDFIDIKVSQD